MTIELRNRVSLRRPRGVVPRIMWTVLLGLMFLVLSGCASMKQAGEDCRKSESAIKTELGVDAMVNAHTSSINGVSTVVVSVKLKTPLPGDAGAIKGKVEDIVNRSFRAHVNRVDLAF